MSKQLTEKKKVKRQVYTIIVETTASGASNMVRTNDGFNPLKLLGVLELTQSEIVETMAILSRQQ